MEENPDQKLSKGQKKKLQQQRAAARAAEEAGDVPMDAAGDVPMGEVDAAAASLERLSVADPEVTEVLTLDPFHFMVQCLFDEFDADEDGYLSKKEFEALDGATEEEPTKLTPALWAAIRRVAGATSDRGLDVGDLAAIYGEPGQQAFSTNIASDFEGVFPEKAQVALIFDAFDTDEDGFLSRGELENLLQRVEHPHFVEGLNDTDYESILEATGAKEPAKGIGLKELVILYEDPSFEPLREQHLRVAGDKMGMEVDEEGDGAG
mmetsp:Transcript_81967/g.187608  ORF Transcript_81967/g.187608 Transcript_81967/m.187608 type:complete len:264 (+) Transcript_81967:1-792(+)